MNPNSLSSVAPVVEALPAPVGLAHAIVQRLASQRAACKLWSVVLTVAVLVVVSIHGGPMSLLWAVAPVLLLALVDAANLVEARRVAGLALDGSVKAGSESGKAVELLWAQVKGAGFSQVVANLLGVFALSVGPFYLGLAGAVVVLAQTGVLASLKTGPNGAFPGASLPQMTFGQPVRPQPLGSQYPPPVAQPGSAVAHRQFPSNLSPELRARIEQAQAQSLHGKNGAPNGILPGGPAGFPGVRPQLPPGVTDPRRPSSPSLPGTFPVKPVSGAPVPPGAAPLTGTGANGQNGQNGPVPAAVSPGVGPVPPSSAPVAPPAAGGAK